MEDRIQGSIREGAGLDESRLNQDFIEFLRKWSTPALVVIAAIAGGYFLYGKYEQSRHTAMARAFSELDAAVVSRKPESLIRVAEEQSGKAAVPLLARLAAADLYLEASRTGVPPGLSIDALGALPEGTTFLTDEQRKEQLTKAEAEYGTVLSRAGRDEGMSIHAVGSLFGLASVFESRGEMDKAREQYARLIEIANAAGYTREATAAQKRIDTLPTLVTMPRIIPQSELFVVKSAVTPMQVKTSDGSVVTVEAAGTGLDPNKQPEVPPAPPQVDPALTPSNRPPASIPPPAPTPAAAPAAAPAVDDFESVVA